MKIYYSKVYGIKILVVCLALFLLGCQSDQTDRAINIESDSGGSEFYSGDKPNDSNPVDSNEQTIINSCPGAPAQRVKVGDRAYVSTKNDRLIVRKDGYKNATEIARIQPGTYFYIIDGPKCDESNGWTYWKIETDNGLVGWVSEGGDNIDYYFIAPSD